MVLKSTNPADGKLIRQYDEAAPDSVKQRIEKAQAAFESLAPQ